MPVRHWGCVEGGADHAAEVLPNLLSSFSLCGVHVYFRYVPTKRGTSEPIVYICHMSYDICHTDKASCSWIGDSEAGKGKGKTSWGQNGKGKVTKHICLP